MIGGHELTTLLILQYGEAVETSWIARSCGHRTADARRMLQRMAKRGLVEGLRKRLCGPVVQWRITRLGAEIVDKKGP